MQCEPVSAVGVALFGPHDQSKLGASLLILLHDFDFYDTSNSDHIAGNLAKNIWFLYRYKKHLLTKIGTHHIRLLVLRKHWCNFLCNVNQSRLLAWLLFGPHDQSKLGASLLILLHDFDFYDTSNSDHIAGNLAKNIWFLYRYKKHLLTKIGTHHIRVV